MTVRNAASMGAYGANWSARGYSGSGNVEALINSELGKPAIVAGGSELVFDDINRAWPILRSQYHIDPLMFVVNDVGMFLPRLDHWVTLHSDFLGSWKTTRWLHPAEREVTKYHAPDKRPYVDYVWEQLTPLFCLSGYFAMQLAWLMGCSPIVLCGIPGDSTRRFFDLSPRTDFAYGAGSDGQEDGVRKQLKDEMERLPQFYSAVKSMSGWTRTYFGGLQ